MIEIIRVNQPHVQLYCPDNVLIGTLFNEHELNKVRIQIAKKDKSGYYIMWGDVRLDIDKDGKLSDWPCGMYDNFSHDMAELFGIQQDKRKRNEP
jgi:predicted ATPase